MKQKFILIGALILQLGFAARALAQSSDSPIPIRGDSELEQLLGPVALYPDPLIAQLLPAAVQPADIVVADRYVQGGGDPNQIEAQPWNPSVKAMAHYPEVLKWMDDNLSWTTEVGQAFLAQPEDVMNAIQRLRAQAQSLGNLQSTPQQQVVVDSGDIEIVPANPEVIYVPSYEPEVVYTRRPVFGAGPFISFGLGFSIGAWLNHDWDWRNHRVVVWDRGHARPSDWWYHPGPDRFRSREVVNNFHVWRPNVRDRSPSNREDRGWAVRQPQRAPEHVVESRPRESQPVRQAPPARQPEPVRQAPPVRQPEVRREPEPRREQARPPVQQVQPAQPARAPYYSAPAPASRAETRAPAPAPAANGTLLGVHSARDTRDFSNRGQQSRQVQTSPPPQQRAAPPQQRSAPPAQAPPRGDSKQHDDAGRNKH